MPCKYGVRAAAPEDSDPAAPTPVAPPPQNPAPAPALWPARPRPAAGPVRRPGRHRAAAQCRHRGPMQRAAGGSWLLHRPRSQSMQVTASRASPITGSQAVNCTARIAGSLTAMLRASAADNHASALSIEPSTRRRAHAATVRPPGASRARQCSGGPTMAPEMNNPSTSIHRPAQAMSAPLDNVSIQRCRSRRTRRLKSSHCLPRERSMRFTSISVKASPQPVSVCRPAV